MKKLFLSLILFCISTSAFAIGEVFQISSSGTVYCGGLKPAPFTKTNTSPLWLVLDSTSEASLYSNPSLTNLITTLNMERNSYSDTKDSFVGFGGSSTSFISVVGTFTISKKDWKIKSMTGTAIQNNAVNNCYSKAKIAGKVIL